MITVYNFPRGTRGLRAVWLAEEMGLPYRFEAVGYPPSAEYLTLNPLGSVPFLTDEGGVAINESVSHLLYLAGRYGPTPLLPAPTAPDYARVLQMTVFGEATLGALINTLLMAKFGGPQEEQGVWLAKASEERCMKAIDLVAGIVGSRECVAGQAFTIADISVVTAFMIWRGAWKDNLPKALAAYVGRHTARPACARAQAAMQRDR